MFLLVALQLQVASPTFTVPRVEADVAIDGALNEPAWQSAARLTDFHQYEPVDGRSAEERTEVLVFYSARAIHFGVIANAKDPSTVRATLADRDNIGTDDRVTIYLDTFDDRRRAFMFGVNPLGVQEDGVRTEGAVSAGNIFGGSVDLNPDYLFDSKGQITKEGYVVEVRIPFKSLRFPGSGPQRWGINVVRDVASTGYRDTWTDVRRASASFLAQSGRMEGIENVVRGVVTEVQPFVTATMTGARPSEDARYERDDLEPDAGANLRFGFPEFSLDATINPDFSQVESDVGLVTVNERFALFIPEKRPFFLEGIELFSTPNQLVYTRQIAQPVGGVKVTGKLGRYSVAYLSAVEEVGRNPLFNIARLRADFGGSSLVGLALTDWRERRKFNTVAAADVRYVFGRLYYFEGQAGGSWTRDSVGDTRPASLWRTEFDRTGRSWGFNYLLNGIDDEFRSAAGFVPRPGVVEGHAFNRFSLYGRRGALVENFTFFFGPSRLWEYGSFPDASPVEGSELLGGFTNFRGGWRLNWGVFRQLVIFGRAQFGGLQTLDVGSNTFSPYDGPRELSNLWGDSISVSTPVFSKWHATLGAARFATPIFFEGAEGDATRFTGSVTLRPTPNIRVEALAVALHIDRDRDGSEFARTIIPRLKLEYQPTRALFFRAIGEWRDERRDILRDATTGAPLFSGDEPIPAVDDKTLRTDWLISFEPTPGTVAFLGYGSTLEAPDGASWSRMRRSADGLFVKLAYQFRR